MSHAVNHFFAPTVPFRTLAQKSPARAANAAFGFEFTNPAPIGEVVQGGLFLATALMPAAVAYLSFTGL